jgi:glucokinase
MAGNRKRNDREPLVLGIDLGGTKILSAVVDAQGRMLSRDHNVTPAAEGREAVINSILESATCAVRQAGIDIPDLNSVGVGAPGLVNAEAGILLTSPNLPGWRDVPLREILEEELNKRTFLINDANAAALAELHFGAGRGARHFIYITISTGIGGGIVIDGELYSGSTGLAGELGHMTLEARGPLCSCGNYGCWETLASGTALAKEAVRRIEEGVPTTLLEHAGGDRNKVTAEVIEKAAEAGDALAKELIARTSEYLGIGLANLINIFNPERIVIGGGLSRMGDKLLLPAFETAEKRAFQHAYRAVRFARAELGRNSGVIGAASFALRAMKQPGRPGNRARL